MTWKGKIMGFNFRGGYWNSKDNAGVFNMLLTKKQRWLDRAKTAGLTLLVASLFFGAQALTSNDPIEQKTARDDELSCVGEFKFAGGGKTWRAGKIVQNPDVLAKPLTCPIKDKC